MTAKETDQPTATIIALDFTQLRLPKNLNLEAISRRLGDDRLRDAIAPSQSVRAALEVKKSRR
jgi:hypothetical protein